MKLASITLPISPTTKLGHAEIERTLLAYCAGYTRIRVRGAWRGQSGQVEYENGYRYELTSNDDQVARKDLVALAYRIKILTDEEAIFIVHANGDTEIV